MHIKFSKKINFGTCVCTLILSKRIRRIQKIANIQNLESSVYLEKEFDWTSSGCLI